MSAGQELKPAFDHSSLCPADATATAMPGSFPFCSSATAMPCSFTFCSSMSPPWNSTYSHYRKDEAALLLYQNWVVLWVYLIFWNRNCLHLCNNNCNVIHLTTYSNKNSNFDTSKFTDLAMYNIERGIFWRGYPCLLVWPQVTFSTRGHRNPACKYPEWNMFRRWWRKQWHVNENTARGVSYWISPYSGPPLSRVNQI